MIILLDSTCHNTGQSVLTYMLAKVHGNLMNQPCLFMSLGSSEFYKSAISLDANWEAQPISMVVNKVHGRNDFRPFCFKLEDTVYYYNATNLNAKSERSLVDLKKLLEKAQKDFGLILIDVDSGICGFSRLVEKADKVILSLPSDAQALKKTKQTIQDIKTNYELTNGLPVKADFLYVLNKYDKAIDIGQAARLLGVKPANVCTVPYSHTLAVQKNQRRLDYFVAETLTSARSTELKTLYIALTRIRNLFKRNVK